MTWLIFGAVAGATLSMIAVLVIIWKILGFFANVSRLHPVIMEMASQFKTDTGSSLKDQINRLESAAHDASTAAKTAREVAEMARRGNDQQNMILETLRVEVLRQGLLHSMQAAGFAGPPAAPPEVPTTAEQIASGLLKKV